MNTENQMDIEDIQDPENIVETHSKEQESAFLNSVAEEEKDFDSDNSPEVKKLQDGQSAVEKAALKMGEQSAIAGLGVIEQMIKQFGHKQFAFDPEQAQNLAEATAPLMLKYNGEMPPWLVAYKEELAFTIAAGGLAFGSVQQVRFLKASDAAKLIEQKKEAQKEAESDATYQPE